MANTTGDTAGLPAEIDIGIAHMSRAYDYLLGGEAHFDADRKMIHQAAEAYGGIDRARRDARANRDFLARAVQYLATEVGIRQFLDLGTGIPNDDNVHAIARQVAPESRIVYVDWDPVVGAHAHQLLDGVERTDYVTADVRDPEAILRRAAHTLDFDRPVGVMCVAILHALVDDEDPCGIVARLVDAVCPGSYLTVSHLASDIEPDASAEFIRRMNEQSRETYQLRSRDEVARFFDGLELVEPGVVQADWWRATPTSDTHEVIVWGAVGRK